MDRQPAGVYHPRNPRDSPLFTLVEGHFDRFEQVYDDVYELEYGFWRPILREVIDKYIHCGDLHCGFARVRCPSCANECLLVFSCRGRYFCPSCHAKRVALFASRLESEVLAPVAHRQYVFTIPKLLRLHFRFARRLLGILSSCAYRSILEMMRAVVSETWRRPRYGGVHPDLRLCSEFFYVLSLKEEG